MKSSLWCKVGIHKYRTIRKFLYVEQVDESLKLHYFESRKCVHCEKIVMPECFNKKWRKKHPPLTVEQSDMPYALDETVWAQWEYTRREIDV